MLFGLWRLHCAGPFESKKGNALMILIRTSLQTRISVPAAAGASRTLCYPRACIRNAPPQPNVTRNGEKYSPARKLLARANKKVLPHPKSKKVSGRQPSVSGRSMHLRLVSKPWKRRGASPSILGGWIRSSGSTHHQKQDWPYGSKLKTVSGEHAAML